MAAEPAERRRAWALLLLLAAVFGVLVAVWTPWGIPGTGAPRPPAEEFFSAQEIARSEAFSAAIKWPGRLSLVVGLVVAALLGFSRVGRRLVAWVRARVGRWWVQVVVLAVAVTLIQRIVGLPFSVWARSISLDYGLATDSWAAWAVDVVTSWAISTTVTTLAMLALVALARRLPSRWYLAAAGGAAALVVSLSFVYPVVFEPIFNDFTSMPDSALRTDLIELAEQDGLEVSDVLVADASRRTTALNAYVSGFGSTKRIVVYDNLVDNAPPAEVRLIVAHELSHAKYDDVLNGTVEGAVGAGFAMVGLFLLLSADRVRRPLGARAAGDPAAVPVVLALVAFGMFLSAPIQNTISRQVEARADAHSLELTDDPDTFIDIQQRLAVTNISNLDPNPVLSFWFGSHPTTLDRIGMALDYGSGQAQAGSAP